MHLLRLAHSMTSILCLFIIIGIEVYVVEYDGVGRREVDAEAARLRGQQEHEDRRVQVECVNHVLSGTDGKYLHAGVITLRC